ncbi:hypothetical protein [Halapricum desulfuricans]|uniref:Uncharacterized protein n=1 Tax=Halapricum desulfuricans TaxID=2841257 RepID=A0A897MWB3_9EURY|nr:hypothetical protein [Halapricum desulfuricans]QSG04882.1 hypothetical protein HSR121_0527 [Halapricum desulfuricans]
MNDTRQGRSDEVGARATTFGDGPASSIRDDVRTSAAEGATGVPGRR